MLKYQVTVKYGNPGEFKHNSQLITVEAETEESAMELAVNKLLNSNPTYKDKEAVALKPKKL